jgi:hypothetical protein
LDARTRKKVYENPGAKAHSMTSLDKRIRGAKGALCPPRRTQKDAGDACGLQVSIPRL